jgi:hypothetical protein
MSFLIGLAMVLYHALAELLREIARLLLGELAELDFEPPPFVASITNCDRPPLRALLASAGAGLVAGSFGFRRGEAAHGSQDDRERSARQEWAWSARTCGGGVCRKDKAVYLLGRIGRCGGPE